MNTSTTSQRTLVVHAIDPNRLDQIRAAGADLQGNPFVVLEASGKGEPLRCCLRFARAGEPIALISHAPFDDPSPWREVGPVYVHAGQCAGYADTTSVPHELSQGPVILRTYHADGSMDYAHNTRVEEGEHIEPALRRLLDEPEVATAHVRTVLPQCFLYTVTAGADLD